MVDGLDDAPAVLTALARTVRANLPQQREHPSHEVLVDDWSHAYGLGRNRRVSHALKQVVLSVARRLDDAGLGRLRLGRRGKKTRFGLPPAELPAWLQVLEGKDPQSAADPGLPPPAAQHDAPPPAAQRDAPPPAALSRDVAPAARIDHRDGSPDGATTAGLRSPRPSGPAPTERAAAGGHDQPPARAVREPDGAGLRTPVRSTEHAAPSGHSDPSRALLAHRFVLRPGLAVTFELPVDLTGAEARRLARFVTALPFDGGADEP